MSQLAAMMQEATALNAAYAEGLISRALWLNELAKLRSDGGTARAGSGQAAGAAGAACQNQESLATVGLRSRCSSPSGSSNGSVSPNQSHSDLSSVSAREDENVDDASDEERTSTSRELEMLETVKPGTKCIHDSKGEVEVIRIGGPQDFFNRGRIYVQFRQLKNGCRHKYETKYCWVTTDSLRLLGASEPCSPRALSQAGLDEVEEGNECEVSPFAQDVVNAEQLPRRAAHERKRKIPERPSRRTRGSQRLPMKKNRARTAPDVRIAQFPGEPLKVDGTNIRCTVCKRSYKNRWSDIRQHVSTELHIQAVEKSKNRRCDDSQLKVIRMLFL